MLILKKNIFFSFLISQFILCSLNLFSQIEHRFNYYIPLDFQLNPAKIENNKNGIYFYHKNQWLKSFTSFRKFNSISGHYKLKDNFFIGGNLNSNKYSNSFMTNIFQLNGAWKGNLNDENDKYFSLGLGVKYYRMNYQPQDLIIFDNFDPQFLNIEYKNKKTDFSSGIFFRFKSLKLSFANTDLIGLVSKKQYNRNNEMIFEIGYLFNTTDNSDHYYDELTQINFRISKSELYYEKISVDINYDYYANQNYALGVGIRQNFKNEFSFSTMESNALFFRVLFKLGKIQKFTCGLGYDVNTGMKSGYLPSSYDLLIGYQKE